MDSNDGRRIYLSDDNGYVFALDRDLNEIWRINMGEQVAASMPSEVQSSRDRRSTVLRRIVGMTSKYRP